MALEGAYKASEEDPAYKVACQWVAEGKTKAEVVNAGHTNPVHQYKQWWDELSVLEEPDKKEGKGRKLLIFNCDKLVVPKPLVATLIDIALQPHKGEQITLAFLKRYYIRQGMNNQVRQKCRECVPCNTYTKVRSQKKKRYYLVIFPNMGGGVFPNPKTFVNLPSIFLYAKFILRC